MAKVRSRKIRVVRISGIVLVVLLAAIVAIPFVIDADQFRPKLESELTGALGREVRIGRLKLSIFSGSVAAAAIAIADDPAYSRAPFVTAESLHVGVELKPLIFSRAVRVTGITLDRPEIALIRSASGEWNFSTLGRTTGPAARSTQAASPGGSPLPEVSVALLKVIDGRVTIANSGQPGPRHIYDKVNITARNLSFAGAFTFSLSAALPGGGGVRLEGQAGPADRTDVSLTPFSAKISLTGLNPIEAGFLTRDSGLAGVIDFEGTASSDGKFMESKGKATAEKIRIVKTGSPAGRPVSVLYQVRHNLKSQTGVLTGTEVDIGKAVAHLGGTYEMRGDSTYLRMKLEGENMPAQDLEALLPAIGATLPKGASLQSGTLNVDVAAEGPVEKLVSAGTVGVSNARLAGFDLGGKVAAVAKLAGFKSSPATEIEKFASELRLEPEGIRVSSLTLIVPALGELTGTGTIGANNELDFRMLVKVATSEGVLGGVARLAGLKGGGVMSVPFLVRGTTSDPSFAPDVKGMAGSLVDSLTGKGAQPGQGQPAKSLGDALKNLFGKKKQP
jgi:AsmA protein